MVLSLLSKLEVTYISHIPVYVQMEKEMLYFQRFMHPFKMQYKTKIQLVVLQGILLKAFSCFVPYTWWKFVIDLHFILNPHTYIPVCVYVCGVSLCADRLTKDTNTSTMCLLLCNNKLWSDLAYSIYVCHTCIFYLPFQLQQTIILISNIAIRTLSKTSSKHWTHWL